MFNLKHLGRVVLVIFVCFTSAIAVHSDAEDPQLIKLRHQLALQYLEPAPHMELAKYFWEKGDRLQAFYLLESARRGRFPEAQFDRAFFKTFSGPRTSAAKAEMLFKKAAELQNEGRVKEAEEEFVKAAELAPHSILIQSWVGRYFFKVRGDDQRALHYYLNAYFLSPHAYETEFVESRIRKISYEAATIQYGQLARSDTKAEEILRDANPTVVVIALEQLGEHWRPEYINLMLNCLSHDDEGVRWLATEALKKNVDRSFDETLRALLQDTDLRKRGLAAYIAIHLWKQQSFVVLRGMLREKAHLLRFDAISALAMEGGAEARRILTAHRREETHPTLIRLIDRRPDAAPKSVVSGI
ncbi:MAG: HEAT repeat domain-containing protein [Pyrinomonadaceae bacterium]